jgi:hypothetical protein
LARWSIRAEANGARSLHSFFTHRFALLPQWTLLEKFTELERTLKEKDSKLEEATERARLLEEENARLRKR